MSCKICEFANITELTTPESCFSYKMRIKKIARSRCHLLYLTQMGERGIAGLRQSPAAECPKVLSASPPPGNFKCMVKRFFSVYRGHSNMYQKHANRYRIWQKTSNSRAEVCTHTWYMDLAKWHEWPGLLDSYKHAHLTEVALIVKTCKAINVAVTFMVT